MAGRKHAAPASPRWEFDESIPTYGFFEGLTSDDTWGLQEVVENFIYLLEDERFAAWDAVVCEEQGLPLTDEQEELLDGLLDLGALEDNRVLYINGIPRTSQPWHVILNKVVPHLLIEPFRTFDIQDEVQCEGWPRIAHALQEYRDDLSLPPGVTSPIEAVPAVLRHRLWLQDCFDALGGLGQDEDLNLQEQPWRIGDFVDRLRARRDSVAHFELTLDSLQTWVILPESDKPLFVRMMQEKLGLAGTDEPIADRL